jgi:alkanesulfonate monooxygenase SsuD/methylene tetrahydromethanopterin reductase-like flavin-dependent oxidoreductase (luciferase family)
MSGQRLSIGLQGSNARDIIELADAAEREAVDAIWIGSPDRGSEDPGDSFRTMVAAAVAARTHFIRIGCMLTFRDPESTLRLAEDVAMIDEAAGGRLELLLQLDDADCEERAGRMMSAWRGWDTADGRRFPVTPRPVQPSIPRLVAAPGFGSRAATRLGAGVLVPADDLPAAASRRTRFDRRVVAFEVRSARELIAGGAAEAIAGMRDVADRWEVDEVAVWLEPARREEIADEVRLLARVVAPGVAGGDAQWEMLVELGARAAGVGQPV